MGEVMGGLFGGGEASTGQSEAAIQAITHQMNLGQQGWTDYLEQTNQLFPNYIQQALAQLSATEGNVTGLAGTANTAIQNSLANALARGGQAQTYLDQAWNTGRSDVTSSLADVIGTGNTARSASMNLLNGNTSIEDSAILSSLANAVNSQAAGGGSLLSGNTTQELYENAALPTLTALLQGYAPMVSQGATASGLQASTLANLDQNYGNQSASNQQWMGTQNTNAGTATAGIYSQLASLLSQLGQQGSQTLSNYPVNYASAIKPYNNQGTFAQALTSGASNVDSANTWQNANSSNIASNLVTGGLGLLFG